MKLAETGVSRPDPRFLRWHPAGDRRSGGEPVAVNRPAPSVAPALAAPCPRHPFHRRPSLPAPAPTSALPRPGQRFVASSSLTISVGGGLRLIRGHGVG